MKTGTGWVRCDPQTKIDDTWCFPQYVAEEGQLMEENSVNALARAACNHFMELSRNCRYNEQWPFVIVAASPELAKRAKSLRKKMMEICIKSMSRVMKLSKDRVGESRKYSGLLGVLISPTELWVFQSFWFGGQSRMRDDPLAPSRSYLKAEEAFSVMNRQPQSGETVVDLGAAPGGWSYAAAKRGAFITAIDNGPMKNGAHNHDSIQHVKSDGISYAPKRKGFDWLFCDMVEDPSRVLELLQRWISQKWCTHFVVNLKYGHTDPMLLLKRIYSPNHGLYRTINDLRVRHLYHDREEMTLMGSCK